MKRTNPGRGALLSSFSFLSSSREGGYEGPAPGEPRLHVVAAEESIGAADLEMATRLFGRWVARAFASNPEAFGPVSGQRREDADGATDTGLDTPARGGGG